MTTSIENSDCVHVFVGFVAAKPDEVSPAAHWWISRGVLDWISGLMPGPDRHDEALNPKQLRAHDWLTLVMIIGSLKSSFCLLSTVTASAWDRTPLALVPLSELCLPHFSLCCQKNKITDSRQLGTHPRIHFSPVSFLQVLVCQKAWWK